MPTNTISGLGLDPSLTQSTVLEKTDNKDQVDQNEFIQLLVTQLQHQDPLDPMQNEEFAVQLAQFSQVQELIDINSKLDAQAGNDFSTLASYLGNAVTLNSSVVEVEGDDAGQVQFELSEGTSDARVEFLDAFGTVRGTLDLGALDIGKHVASLSDLSLAPGQYAVRVAGEGLSGTPVEAEAYAYGIVSGYVPGPEPVLLLGNREIGVSDIQKVEVPA
ncbi:MAG: hypothetical protein KDD64_06810 [Bdellovibrionales bacterium]|nr:hypothetical protein [Bdellovibrionales bacterium]